MDLKLVIDSEVFNQVKDVYSKRPRAHDRMLGCLVVHMKMPDARRKVVGALSCRIVETYDSAIACGDFGHGFDYTEHMFGKLGEQESGDVTNG